VALPATFYGGEQGERETYRVEVEEGLCGRLAAEEVGAARAVLV